MRYKNLLIPIMLLGLMVAASSYLPMRQAAAPGDWFFLGDKSVGFGVDHDVIRFGNWKDDVRQIKLKITDGPLKMYDMKIYFDNGGVQDVPIRHRFVAGSESRVIDLDGGLRHLSRIEFWYETKGVRKGRARVAVWGRN
ncbi:MAG TPA: hypothetical protein VEB63_05175 [Chitinophagaceae bacterium]|nr:hypothetical protein [Chitinophagaceae bacterium]